MSFRKDKLSDFFYKIHPAAFFILVCIMIIVLYLMSRVYFRVNEIINQMDL